MVEYLAQPFFSLWASFDQQERPLQYFGSFKATAYSALKWVAAMPTTLLAASNWQIVITFLV